MAGVCLRVIYISNISAIIDHMSSAIYSGEGDRQQVFSPFGLILYVLCTCSVYSM